ncbi:MAG: deoxyribose-phosphate aldolase [Lachnospiraceae bacterium]|nr:deoxyribose-phosphate aldolase [Lachnospiraceae bacterium]
MTRETMAKMIDHTLLKQNASEDQIKKLCAEAKENGFWSVCINPCYVALCAEELKDSDVKVCTVVGFPLGASTTETTVFQSVEAIKNGASEIDMVINVGAIKSGNWDYVYNDIKAVADAVKANGGLLKVIIETCLLSDDEKIKACEISKKAGADFVKTSTGFSTGGATVDDIKLMRNTVGPDMGVKASGGIHNAKEALAMAEAGASRIGASAGIEILNGLN